MKVFEKMKETIISICVLIGTFFSGFLVAFLVQSNKKTKESDKDFLEAKRNEIKNTNASDIIESADNSEELFSRIDELSKESNQRIRDRIKQKL